MANLKLRNCTKFQLQYKVIILGARWHQLKPGEEGIDIKHAATFTLRVERTDDPKSTTTRAAVNPNGTYYAVYVNNKVKILTENQAKGFAKNDDNPYITKWFPEKKGDRKEIKQKVEWEVILSRYNNTDTPIELTFEEVIGFSEKVSSSHQLVIEKSDSKEFSVGAEFTVKEVGISGSFSSSESSTETDFQEELTEYELYESKTQTTTLNLKPGESWAVWQPRISVFGHKIMLDHLEYREAKDGQPDNFRFKPAELYFDYFEK